MPSYIDSQDEDLATSYLHIPDMLASWPWQRKINPFYEEVSAESNAWVRSFSPFTAKSQHSFERCDLGLLASLVFPDARRDQLRTANDLVNIFFVFDEYTDVESAPTVRGIVDVCTDAMHNPSKPRPEKSSSVKWSDSKHVAPPISPYNFVLIASDCVPPTRFWERGRRSVSDQTGPFVASFVAYMNAVVAQAEALDRGGFLTVDAFLAIRREDAGARPFYTLGALFLSIPDHFHDDPLHARMIGLGCDLVAIDNDMVSYNREQASGNGDFNFITLTMHHHGLTLHDAARRLVEKVTELDAQFMQCHSEFCAAVGEASGGTAAIQWQEYMDHVQRECVSGVLELELRAVRLIPKKMRNANLRENQVDVFLMEEGLAKV
ncbi:terpene synthase [Ganoderma sinense ZZ0214-1]|uniref:Terpene synthase n=1 Tax=Ganoderma sinense ZZ0214-1 TaxID=1077348 RepID=A0A2G8S3W6_9APHY|nr:terpene synthase [Ganoderma sinense ZZ0214-1]